MRSAMTSFVNSGTTWDLMCMKHGTAVGIVIKQIGRSLSNTTVTYAARHQHSGTSPTNGHRSVAPTTPTADTHRDLVRRQAAERISVETLQGEPGKLLYPIQVRDGKHFDNEDAK
ncbi:unnamed protein product [Tilletia controversa]|nr:unnamed protein product [Tilletia controversa]